MEQTAPTCINHPDVETRISCSSCERPICTRCMRQAAVGQKCPDCARTPRSARALGKPIHYVRAAAAGTGAAVGGGLALNVFLGAIGFGAILLSAALGFGVGRAVGWGAMRQTSQGFVWMAVVLGALGAVIAAGGPAALNQGLRLLGVVAAGYMANRALHS